MMYIMLLGFTIVLSTSCGFRLRSSHKIPEKLQNIVLESNDPYGALTRSILNKLRFNNINIINDATRQDLITLRIIDSYCTKNTISIFKNGTSAENQLEFKLRTKILIPNQGIYPLNVTVFRYFFNNPLKVLAKEAESEIIYQEMRDQLAEKLISKLLKLDIVNNDNKEKKSDLLIIH